MVLIISERVVIISKSGGSAGGEDDGVDVVKGKCNLLRRVWGGGGDVMASWRWLWLVDRVG